MFSWLMRLFIKLFPTYRFPGKFKYQYGIRKDKEDSRDYHFIGIETELPKVHSLSINPFDYVKDQGEWNSCGSHSMATSIEILHNLQETRLKTVELSERYHYYRARERGGNFPKNGGMTSRTMLKTAQREGICPEKIMPYVFTEMNDPVTYFADSFAKWWKIGTYHRVSSLQSVKEVILIGHPVLIGVWINKSFKSFTDPIVVVNGERIYGGHELVIYGYDDNAQVFKCINSWGKNHKGTGLMDLPYKYVANYLIDMWMFNLKED